MKLDNKDKTAELIGIDIGGTWIRAGRVCHGHISQLAAKKIPKTNNPDEVTKALFHTISEVFSDNISGIGIGLPSLIDSESGTIYDFQNIPAWKNIRLGHLVQDKFDKPVYLNNDANCFAAGECFFGEGQNFSHFAGLITGTGLGAGIIHNKHLISGVNHGAGEFGVIPYLDRDYEFYASSHFFTHYYGVEADLLAKKAFAGDSHAREAFDQYGKHLGVVIKTIIACLDPEAIIIGGGISNAFDLYKAAMWNEMVSYPFQQCIDRLKILKSNLPEVAILGAAALYYNATNH